MTTKNIKYLNLVIPVNVSAINKDIKVDIEEQSKKITNNNICHY